MFTKQAKIINRFKAEYIKGLKKRPFLGDFTTPRDPSLIKRNSSDSLVQKLYRKSHGKSVDNMVKKILEVKELRVDDIPIVCGKGANL